MAEFNELFDEEFFIIDSNNLNNIRTRFYGYSIINNEIFYEDSLINENDLNGCGAYLYVNVTDKFIYINQDFNGSFGLYYFKHDDYFAISNSFLKLVEYLKSRGYFLSINNEYAESFLFADLCSYAYCETLVNEIQLLPRNYKVIINKFDNKISFVKLDYEERSVNIDSKEALDILDSWYFRWVGLIRSIKSKTNNISIDLTGGFDSRIVACLWLTANIDLAKVHINTHSNNLTGSKIEDFEISSKIAREFDFKLNNSSFSLYYHYFEDIHTIMDIIFYIKFGFHKQWYYKFYKLSQPIFDVTGGGGEPLRGYPNKTSEEYLKHVCNYCYPDDKLINSTISTVKRAWSKLISQFEVNEEGEKLPNLHYNEVRNRHHFGKGAMESFFANHITLSPLIDPELYKLKFFNNVCNDSSLLFALIYTRYCPKLLDFEFEGNREIPSKVKEFARQLNEKYPFVPKEYDFISGPSVEVVQKSNLSNISNYVVNENLKRIFYSNAFKTDFCNIFSEFSYKKISKCIETQNFFH